MAGKKIPLSSYIIDNCLDLNDENTIRWVYYGKNKTNYMVTRNGEVISIKKSSKKYLRHKIDRDGYHHVTIYVNKIPHYICVHRLVAQAFIPNLENKPEVNHKDGNKDNNVVENLEWVTTKENIQHAWRMGLATAKFNENHPNSVYADDQIHNVCRHLVKNTNTMMEISKLTGVSYTVVKQIRNKVIHRKISDQYDFSRYNVSGRCKKPKIIKGVINMKTKENPSNPKK